MARGWRPGPLGPLAPLVRLLLLALALLAAPHRTAAQGCSGTSWTGPLPALYDCSSSSTAYAASFNNTPNDAAANAGGLLGAPLNPAGAKCLSGAPTNATELASIWYTSNSGVTKSTTVVTFDSALYAASVGYVAG
ncbi:hypothetical protein HXX76_004237 [Chlamydomonas incerta]|uniref:Uncharacterized protein n=1 Tax=Chlamydomonas incerta TaxID=51695 RepID=A0A835T7G1_CHLIN|nr:hypothetical protein HXX76_004237 [Chlamydomonas incerta]|eukprot:KAG2440123.1 hypothetical protein HXX76_004237 [Chlamydomonas incerta]